MVIVRTPQELLDLVKDVPSDVRDSQGEYREPERCPTCRDLLTPAFAKGRTVMVCPACEDDD